MCRTVGTKIPSESPSQVSLFTVCLATVKRSRNFVQMSIRLQPSSQVDGNCSASSLNRPTNSARRPKIIETATKKVGTFFIFCRPLPNERIFHRMRCPFPVHFLPPWPFSGSWLCGCSRFSRPEEAGDVPYPTQKKSSAQLTSTRSCHISHSATKRTHLSCVLKDLAAYLAKYLSLNSLSYSY